MKSQQSVSAKFAPKAGRKNMTTNTMTAVWHKRHGATSNIMLDEHGYWTILMEALQGMQKMKCHMNGRTVGLSIGGSRRTRAAILSALPL